MIYPRYMSWSIVQADGTPSVDDDLTVDAPTEPEFTDEEDFTDVEDTDEDLRPEKCQDSSKLLSLEDPRCLPSFIPSSKCRMSGPLTYQALLSLNGQLSTPMTPMIPSLVPPPLPARDIKH